MSKATASSFEEAFSQIQAEGDRQHDRLVLRQMRKFLAGALCCHCGDQLGEDEEIIQDDEERTCHARCEPKP